jgi:hypothetical protein
MHAPTPLIEPIPHRELSDDERANLQKELDASPVRQVGYWQEQLSKPLPERLGSCDPEMIKHAHRQNLHDGYPERPQALHVSKDQLADARGALLSMPAVVHRLIGSRLSSICFVRDLGSTAWGDSIHDASGKRVATFLVLDMAALDRTANSWATWKENSPFRDESPWRVKMTIESESTNNRLNAIRYILLHEFGHVVTVGRNIHPSWNEPDSAEAAAANPFFLESWLFDGKKYTSRFEDNWGARKHVRYYRHERSDIPDKAIPSLYQDLLNTDFVSLYGATAYHDDFAEAFAVYVHTVLDQRPWKLELFEGERLHQTVGGCLSEPRCAKKKKILDELFATQ